MFLLKPEEEAVKSIFSELFTQKPVITKDALELMIANEQDEYRLNLLVNLGLVTLDANHYAVEQGVRVISINVPKLIFLLESETLGFMPIIMPSPFSLDPTAYRHLSSYNADTQSYSYYDQDVHKQTEANMHVVMHSSPHYHLRILPQ